MAQSRSLNLVTIKYESLTEKVLFSYFLMSVLSFDKVALQWMKYLYEIFMFQSDIALEVLVSKKTVGYNMDIMSGCKPNMISFLIARRFVRSQDSMMALT